MKTKIIPWRAGALILSWLLLAVLLKVINLTVSQIDRVCFGSLILSSASYMLSTVAFFKPLTKGSV